MRFRIWLILLIMVSYYVFMLPFWNGDLFDNVGFFASRKVDIPSEYYDIAKLLNEKKLDSVLYPVPFSSIGMGSFWWDDGKSGYAAINPFIYMLGKKRTFFYGVGVFKNDLFEKVFDGGKYANLFGILNVSDVVFHWDSNWESISKSSVWYPSDKGKAFEYFEKISPESYNIFDVGRLSLVSLKLRGGNRDYFLPHFYIPEQSGITDRSIKELPMMISSDDWKTRSAVFFRSQNPGKDETLDAVKSIGDVSSDGLPTLEFRKINPTKYRVRIHAAQGEFPLVFSESFHDGWKAYLEKASAPEAAKLSLDGYRVLDGNSDDQADADELNDYVTKGWVTDLGSGREKTIEHKKWEDGKEKKDYDEKCRIGFVSKDFQGTIQNDNLLGGSVFETWLKKPIDPADHLKANGYANAWLIDPEALCQGSGKCVRNPDGSYDMEIVVEFWPQRLFYIGLAVSGTTILSCLGYLAWDHRRKKKEEAAA